MPTRVLLTLCLLALPATAQAQPYDLLLKGGHVIDPANNRNEPLDIATKGENIAAVAKNIPAGQARKVIDVSGLYVVPGLIDIHAHTARRPHRASFPADLNLASGLTTVVDAGTFGARNFHLLRSNIMESARIRVLAFINIVASGMGDKEQDVPEMDPELCASVIRHNRDRIVGIKTAHYWTSKPWDEAHPPWAGVDAAVKCGELADAPVMVDFWPRPPERGYRELILDKLRPGDMHTHVFAQQFPILDSDGKVNDILWQARKRGVIFDLGHGAGSFWFRNAVPAVEQGFVPDSISTDLHSGNWNGPVVDMMTTVSKMLAIGVPLEQVIRMSTVNPARQIRRPDLGTLTVGKEADIAVLELRRGRFSYTDCGRAKFTGDKKLENRLTIRAGLVAYDPEGRSMVEWKDAPDQYFKSPKLQGVDPRSSADPVHDEQVRERLKLE